MLTFRRELRYSPACAGNLPPETGRAGMDSGNIAMIAATAVVMAVGIANIVFLVHLLTS